MNTLWKLLRPKGFADGGLLGGALQGLGIESSFQATAPTNGFQSTSPTAASTLAQANAQSAGGAGPASSTIAQQSQLSQALQAAAAGQGPNPALEQLHQTTSANINNAAGMAASARGINPALAARMAVDSAAQANQTAAGQGATMAAQQQIAAREQLGQNLAATGQMQIGQQQAGTQALGTAGGLDLSSQGLNQQTAAQNASLNLGAQQINAGISAQNAATTGQVVGGLLNGIGAAASVVPKFAGGEVGMATGGVATDPLGSYLDSIHGSPAQFADGGAVASHAGDSLAKTASPSAFRSMTSAPVMGASFSNGGSIHSGSVPAMLSPGEKVLPPGTSPKAAAAKLSSAPTVPGKAKVSGDSPKNDTVHARLESGSIVLPRSVVNAKDPGKAAASFVASVMKRHGKPMARGGMAKPEPVEVLDFSQGGFVEKKEAAKREPATAFTARGVGRDEMRRRMKTSSAPAHREEE